ncbi:PadR family transcriptional regulator [Pseudonocardia sp. GCM10023141]|uniref:PadR family transcriptional regulator n=1 Tax=Pseudonocardia sp. GCM10023141 TaxID=3252653 RepID=UPI003611C15C
MSATRLLVLGVVRGYGRAHGYLVGNDLIAWGADEWANVKWGSIYHALKSLTTAGLLIDYNDVPGRTEYELTEAGHDEYLKLLRDAVRRPQPRPDFLGAALAMLPSLTREEAIRLLRERRTTLEQAREKAQAQVDAMVEPPHVRELFGLSEHNAAGGVAWTQGLIERLEAGAYPMAGEPHSPGKPGSWPALQFPPYPPRA